MNDVFRRRSEDPFERDDEGRPSAPAPNARTTPDETAVENVRAQIAGKPPAEPESPDPQEPVSANGPRPEHAPGAVEVPEGVGTYVGTPDGRSRSVAIAVARFNGDVTTRLLEGAVARLEEAGVTRDRIDVVQVPGAFELPLAAMALAKSRRYAGVLALACVIRGDTPHFEYVAAEAASGVQLAGLETGVPVAFGVLTCDDRAQADARAGGEHGNKGAEAAETALEMADVLARLRAETGAPALPSSAARSR